MTEAKTRRPRRKTRAAPKPPGRPRKAPTKMFAFRLPLDLVAAVDRDAERRRWSRNMLMGEALRKWIGRAPMLSHDLPPEKDEAQHDLFA